MSTYNRLVLGNYRIRKVTSRELLMPVIGSQQSPIRIIQNETIFATIDPIRFQYANTLSGQIKGDNFEFDVVYHANSEVTTGKTLLVGEEPWVIRKIHVHGPAEHVIHSDKFDESDPEGFECHLLHSAVGDIKARGPKLVIGVVFKVVPRTGKKTTARPTLFSYSSKLSESGSCTNPPMAHDIDLTDFLPDKDKDKFYRYEGSLTSEPYSEDVSWYVLKHQSEVFQDNVAEILKCAHQHTRKIYSTDRRFVLRNFPKIDSMRLPQGSHKRSNISNG